MSPKTCAQPRTGHGRAEYCGGSRMGVLRNSSSRSVRSAAMERLTVQGFQQMIAC